MGEGYGRGREAVLYRLRAKRQPDRFEVGNYAGDAKSGAMGWTWHCKHEEDILGVPAKGEQTTVRGISYVALQNGKIVAERDYWDCATLLRQLGALK